MTGWLTEDVDFDILVIGLVNFVRVLASNHSQKEEIGALHT